MSTDLNQAKAVIYCRVSSAAQVAKGHGNASQRTRCEEFARMKGYEVTACFEDEAISGGVIDRPGMLSMLAYLKKHKRAGEHVVLIDDISRLARNIRGHLDLRDAISETGARLESPSIEFGEDSDSILVENLLASVSQHQRQKNTEQTAHRMRARLMNGYWTFSCPPGYRYEKSAGEGKVLVRDEPLASILAEGLEGYACGRFQTQAEVKRYFESFPEFPKTRFGTVTNENVNRILTRLVYAGYLERPEWDVSLRKGKHEPLISLETYQRIQQRLSGKAKLPARADLDESFPLRGFVLCGDCEKPLTACWSKSKTGKKHPYYQCFYRSCASNRKSIRKDVIEGQFAALLADIQPSPTMFALAKDMAGSVWGQLGEQAASMREEVRRRIAEIEKQTAALLDRIIEASSQSVITRYEQRINELERERLVMAEKLETKARPRKSFEEMFELTLGILANPCNIWERGSIGYRHAILKMAFTDRLVYCRGGGFRTPKTSIVFRALDRFCGQKEALAEGKRFELSIPVSQYNGLANRRLQPLGHPSARSETAGKPAARRMQRPFYASACALSMNAFIRTVFFRSRHNERGLLRKKVLVSCGFRSFQNDVAGLLANHDRWRVDIPRRHCGEDRSIGDTQILKAVNLQARIDDAGLCVGTHHAGAAWVKNAAALGPDVLEHGFVAVDIGTWKEFFFHNAFHRRRIGELAEEFQAFKIVLQVVLGCEIVGLNFRRGFGIGGAKAQIAAAGRTAGRDTQDKAGEGVRMHQGAFARRTLQITQRREIELHVGPV